MFPWNLCLYSSAFAALEKYNDKLPKIWMLCLLYRDVWFAYYLLLGGLWLLMLGTHYLIMSICYRVRKHFHVTSEKYCISPLYRNREIKQMKDSMKNGNSLSFLCHDINELEHSYQVNLPRVTVVMPLKGFGEHNLHNWRSQVKTHMSHSSETYLLFLFFFWFICGACLIGSFHE
jgi:hypothetical protein